jgi:hypothetical protein
VRAGTPMGALLRRYWHPVGLTADVGPVPKKLLALGEGLIVFRGQRPARAGAPALRAPGIVALLRQGRRPWHPLLLPRLHVRCAGPLRRTSL